MHPTSNNEMNEQLKGRNAIVKLKDRTELSVKEVNVSADSVSWFNQDTDMESQMSMKQLHKITAIKNDHVLGALEGLGIGFAGPFPLTIPIFALSSDGGSHELPWILGPIFFGSIGGAIGLIAGAISGFTFYDEFLLDERNVSGIDSLKSLHNKTDSLSTTPSVSVHETPMMKPDSLIWS